MEENLEPLETSDNDRIIPVNIEEQMKTAYIDYSMSVIVGRALPDVRDGLKPVHRRILFAMNQLGLHYNKPYKKSARLVGEVLGKYHPHGDTSVYDAMVRMAQEWSMRYTMVDGQGNFGNQDGDGPAAMRYTETRLERLAEHMLDDIEKDTVDFQLNFDDTEKEPTVLPTRIPNLLINGSSGIAVGMATNMMPHNLSESIDGCLAYIDNKEITIDELMQHVKAPDFPTGGVIYGMEGVKAAMHFGRGRVVVRGKLTVETKANGKEQIIITEVPYQVNRDALTNRIGELVNEKLTERFAETKSMMENLLKLMEAENAAEIEGAEMPESFMAADEKGNIEEVEIDKVKNKAAAYLAQNMHEANLTLKQLFFLGLDDQDTLVNKGFCSPADILQFAVEKKLALRPYDKDMIVMLHEIEYRIGSQESTVRSSLVVKGENSLRTAMAKTVGLPLGIAAKHILNGKIKMTGLHIPTSKEIYEPVLAELEKYEVKFTEEKK